MKEVFSLFILHRLAFSLVSLYLCHFTSLSTSILCLSSPSSNELESTRSIPILTDYLRALTKTPGKNHHCVGGNFPNDSIKAQTNVRKYIFTNLQ